MRDSPQPGWHLRAPWRVALLCSFVPVVFAVASSVVVQVLELTGTPARLLLTGGTALSALLGLLIMARARPSLAEFGWRRPRHVKHALWFVPILLADPVLTAFQIAFALVFGLVTALLVLRTGSLWPGIVWHIVHNTISLAGPDVPTPAGMVAYGVVSVALLGYAAWLARRP